MPKLKIGSMYNIVAGPSKWDFSVGLLERKPMPKLVEFTIEDQDGRIKVSLALIGIFVTGVSGLNFAGHILQWSSDGGRMKLGCSFYAKGYFDITGRTGGFQILGDDQKLSLP